MPKPLTPELEAIRVKVEKYAKEYGLDFFETNYEIVSYDEMAQTAAYGGFPIRYPHWRWGQEYDQLAKTNEYGLGKIYEMVINNSPATAYLLEGNLPVDQKTVMAHVFGHVDFFKNNFYFQHTNRKALEMMGNHATKIKRLIDKHGLDKIETFIDTCLSLENLIDVHSAYVKRTPDPKLAKEQAESNQVITGFNVTREYMHGYINPLEFLAAQRARVEREAQKARKFPEYPQQDILLFLLDNAPMEEWEYEILAIIREEAYYLAPQGQTKIMNEGWAEYWQSKIMCQKAMEDSEIIDYADHTAGVLATSQGRLNPYKLGLELYRNIEERWDKGQFGPEYERCDDMKVRREWDKKLGLGIQKIFEVRKHYNDINFIDEFLTPEFAIEQKLFTFGYKKEHDTWEIMSKEFKKVKAKLLQGLTNWGQPRIYTQDGNFENRGELLLKHVHEGLDLKDNYAKETLRALQVVWKRPVAILTKDEGKGIMMRYDGKEHAEKRVLQ